MMNPDPSGFEAAWQQHKKRHIMAWAFSIACDALGENAPITF